MTGTTGPSGNLNVTFLMLGKPIGVPWESLEFSAVAVLLVAALLGCADVIPSAPCRCRSSSLDLRHHRHRDHHPRPIPSRRVCAPSLLPRPVCLARIDIIRRRPSACLGGAVLGPASSAHGLTLLPLRR